MFLTTKIVIGLKLMKMGLKDASNKDKMDKTIYQSDYFTGYGVKDWDAISWSMNGPVQVDVDWLWTVEQIVKSEIAWKYPVQSWGHLGTWPVRYCFEVNKILQTFPGLSVTVSSHLSILFPSLYFVGSNSKKTVYIAHEQIIHRQVHHELHVN